jgi:hypothetical protein
MSDALQHECGIALVRNRLSFIKKYGTAFYGMKMYLLMEKQHIEDKMVLVLQV